MSENRNNISPELASATDQFIGEIETILEIHGKPDFLQLTEVDVKDPNFDDHWSGTVDQRGNWPPKVGLRRGSRAAGERWVYHFDDQKGEYVKDSIWYILTWETLPHDEYDISTDEPVNSFELGRVAGILRALKAKPEAPNIADQDPVHIKVEPPRRFSFLSPYFKRS